jgi:O-antigen/teichoic acid export membrane protein
VLDFAGYAAASVYQKGISFVLFILYTHHLSTSEYGVVDLLATFASLAAAVGNLGLESVVTIFYYRVEASDRLRMARQVLGVFARLSLPLFASTALLLPWLERSQVTSVVGLHGYRLVLLTIVVAFVGAVRLNMWKMAQRVRIFVTVQVLSGIAQIAVAAVGLLVLEVGVFAVLLANLALVSLPALLACVGRQPLARPTPVTRADAAGYLRVSLPLVPGMLAAWGMDWADRAVLLAHVETSEIGLYGVGYRFGLLFYSLLHLPFAQAYVPRLFRHYAEDYPNAQARHRRVLIGSSLGAFAFVLALVPLTEQLLPLVLTDAYAGSRTYVVPVTLGYVFYFVAAAANYRLLYLGKTWVFNAALMVACAFNVALNLYDVPRWGAQGAAWATAGAYAVCLGVSQSIAWVRYRDLSPDDSASGRHP